MKAPGINVVSIATAVPEQVILSEEIINELNGQLSDGTVEMLEHMCVNQRYSVIEDYPKFMSGKKERKLICDVNKLATDSINNCVELVKDKLNIGLFIAITNTASRPLPCTAFELAGMIDNTIIPRDANILNLQNQGCSIMVKALEVAQLYLALHEDKQVLITIAEAHTALFPPVGKVAVRSFHEIEQLSPSYDKDEEHKNLIHLVNEYLFGDGAISMLLENDRESSFVTKHLTNIAKKDIDILYMNEGGTLMPFHPGYPEYSLTKSVPKRGMLYSKLLLKSILGESSHEAFMDNLELVLIHTGSKKIVDGVISALNIERMKEKANLSYEIINNFGNLSSGSLAFMLEKAINRDKVSGNILLVSFGVGFSGSMATWRL